MDKTEREHFQNLTRHGRPTQAGPALLIQPRLMGDIQAAAHVGLAPKTLANYRAEDLKRVRRLCRLLVEKEPDLLQEVQRGEVHIEDAAKRTDFGDVPVIQGPRWIAFGKRRLPRYEREELDLWVDKHRIDPIAQALVEDSAEPVREGAQAEARRATAVA